MSQLDYALVGNCQISALLDKEASYVWCCMPRLDSTAVFAELLGTESNGTWKCTPVGEFKTSQRYLDNTNVVQTRFDLKTGEKFEIIDFAPRFYFKDDFFRPPQLIRII